MAPEVRVRLTPEGEAQVEAAFRRVAAEIQRTQRAAAASTNGFASALGGVRGLMAQLGAVVSVGLFTRFITDSIGAADAAGRLAQTAGSTVENFSALRLSAIETDVPIAQLGRQLAVFASNSQEAIQGTPKMVEAFRALGFSMKEIQGLRPLDSVQRLDVVAQKLAKLPDGPQKTALAMDLLGKRGAALIPLLNDLGDKGLEALKERAQELGILLSDEMVNTLDAVDDSMKTLGAQAQGLAQHFAAGMAPAILQSTTAISNALKGSGQVWVEFGQIVGFVLKILVGVLTTFLAHLVTGAKNIGDIIGGIVAVTKRALQGDIVGAYDELGNRLNAISNRMKDTVKRDITLWKDLFTRPAIEAKQTQEAVSESVKQTYAQRRAVVEAAIEAEISLIRASIARLEQAEQSRFNQGLTDVRAFYNARRRLVVEGTNREIAALERRALLEGQTETDPSKLAAAQIKLDAQIRVLNLKRAQELSELDDEEGERIRDLGRTALAIEARILEAQGHRHASRLLQIDEELTAARLALDQLGPSAGDEAERERTIKRLEQALKIELAFTKAQEAANEEFATFAAERARIEDQISSGLVSQVAGTAKLLDLERGRVVALRAAAEAALEAARDTRDPEKIAEAQGVVDAVSRIEAAADTTENAIRRIQATFEDALVSGMEEFFTRGVNEAENLAEAVRNMALSIVSSVQAMVARLIAFRLFRVLAGIFTGGAGGAGGEQASDAVFASEGGPISGPGTPTSDSIPAWLSTGEFVVRSAKAQVPAAQAHLSAYNAGRISLTEFLGAPRFAGGGPVGRAAPNVTEFLAAPRFAAGGPVESALAIFAPRFADGGPVGGEGAALAPISLDGLLTSPSRLSSPAIQSAGGAQRVQVDGEVRVGLEEGLVGRELDTPRGDRLIVKVVSRNRTAFRDLLGGG